MWFILAVLFFILWLVASSSKKRTNKEQYDKGYSEGYWAIGSVLKEELAKKTIDRKKLKQYIVVSDSDTFDDSDVPVEEADQAVATQQAAEDVPFLQQAITESQRPVIASRASPSPSIVEAPVKTKREIAERNLNILLYMSSFLIVAAAAAFIATSMPPAVRLAGLWGVIITFYVVGLVLHAKVSYLRPAATAFIGTGLALVPFAGIALSQLGGLSAGLSWFLTSLVGIVSYAVATLQLRSQVVGYLTIAFSLSFAASTVATVSGPAVLYYVALIVVSLLFHILASLKATWIPELFKVPITQTSHILTPATLVGSLLAYDTMTITSYLIVFWVATAYYAVLWATDKLFVYETVFRILVSISIFLTIIDAVDFALVPGLVTIVAITVTQALYSLVRVRLVSTQSRRAETGWLVVAAGVLLFVLPLWSGTDVAKTGVLAEVLAVLVLSVLAAYRFRGVLYAVPALVATVALPFIIGRWPGELLWSIEYVVWIFIAAAITSLVSFAAVIKRSIQVKGFLQAAYATYILFAFMTSFAQETSTLFILSTIAIALTVLASSYVYRQWWIEVISVTLTVPIAALALRDLGLPSEWLAIGTIAGSTLIYSIALGVHHFTGQFTRRTVLIVATMIVGFGLVFSFGGPEIVSIVALLLALLYAVLAIVFRSIVTSDVLKMLFTAAYVIYPLIMLLFGFSVGFGWAALALATITAVYWVGSYIEQQVGFMIFGNIAFVWLLVTLWQWLKFDPAWISFGVAWISAVVFYGATIVYGFLRPDPTRYSVSLVSTWVVLGFVTLFNLGLTGSQGYAAAASLLALSGTVALHGVLQKRDTILELAVYIGMFALQRIVGLTFPTLNFVFYSHWWAITLVLLALWRKDASYKTRFIIATAFVTIGTGSMALTSGESGYQLLFLVEHVGILVLGALLRASWALWWGLATSILAVLYFLRDSLFLSLLFLGLALLGIVIWRLVRSHQKT